MNSNTKTARPENPETDTQAEEQTNEAWEQVDEGRYRPRRIRGSCQGRELG